MLSTCSHAGHREPLTCSVMQARSKLRTAPLVGLGACQLVAEGDLALGLGHVSHACWVRPPWQPSSPHSRQPALQAAALAVLDTLMLGRGPMGGGPEAAPEAGPPWRPGVVWGEPSGSSGAIPLCRSWASGPDARSSSPSVLSWPESAGGEKAQERGVEVWGVLGAWGESPEGSESSC